MNEAPVAIRTERGEVLIQLFDEVPAGELGAVSPLRLEEDAQGAALDVETADEVGDRLAFLLVFLKQHCAGRAGVRVADLGFQQWRAKNGTDYALVRFTFHLLWDNGDEWVVPAWACMDTPDTWILWTQDDDL